MIEEKPHSPLSRATPLVPSLVAAVLLFLDIGGFGLWEPAELARLNLGARLGGAPACPSRDGDGDCIEDAADKCPMEAETLNGVSDTDGCPDNPPSTGVLLEERLAALSWKAGGGEEWARFPMALLALLALVALQFTVSSLAGRRTGFMAALVMAGSPVFLLNARQVTGHGMLLCGETLALCGLLLAAHESRRRAIILAWVMAATGLAMAWLDSGLLVGVALPCWILLVSESLVNGPRDLFRPRTPDPGSRRLVLLLAAFAGLASTAAFLLAILAAHGDVPLITGGLAHSPPKDFNATVALQQLAYGWFPWSALVPIVLLGIAAGDGVDDSRRPLKLLVITGVALSLLAGTLTHGLRGDQPVFLALPMALGAALALADLERSQAPARLGGLVMLMLAAIMIRDFAQRPEALLLGHALIPFKTPDTFAPVVPVILACLPFGLMVAAAAFVGGGPRWRDLRVRATLPFAAAAFGGYLTLVVVPGLSLNLSSKHVLESYHRFASASEPLGIMGPADLAAEATRLQDQQAVIDWLGREGKVFALVPPSQLAALDRDYRTGTGEHLFVLDAASEKFALITNRPQKGQENENPIVQFVRSEPFEPDPRNKKRINFDDKLTMLGWEVASEDGEPFMKRGKEFSLTTYWRCEAPLGQDYKIFAHIDGPGPRVHGDHDPVRGAFPTRHWSPGDYIKDVFTGSVPAYQETGKYGISIGLYRGDSRLKVIEPIAKEDSVRIGNVTVK